MKEEFMKIMIRLKNIALNIFTDGTPGSAVIRRNGNHL